MMKKTGIICAMQKEYDLLVREFPEGNGMRCVLSGVGKVNAAIAAERLAMEFNPDCMLSIGCAGTFVESVGEGETVIASRCAYHDVWCGEGNEPGRISGLPLYFESDAGLLEKAHAGLPDALVGLLCTGDQFYVSREEDERQKKMFPDALAVDMEGAAVAQVAYLHGIPFLAVKVISDNHCGGRQKERYEGFWNDMAEKSFSSMRKILQRL